MIEQANSKSQSNRVTSVLPRRQRPAEHNSQFIGEDPTVDDLFPSLDPGVTLLEPEGSRPVQELQALVVDHLLTQPGVAYWVDAQGYATTASLAQLTPSRRLLDRIHVARGFTAFQHFGIVWDLRDRINRDIREGFEGRSGNRPKEGNASQEPQTPSIVVAPAFDAQYRACDSLGEDRATDLLVRGLARLTAYARGYDIPVLVTRTAEDSVSKPIANAADHSIRCERTRMGPRFVGDDFETLVYPVDGGRYLQTTITYWRELLAARAQQAGIQPSIDGRSPGQSTAESVDPLSDELCNASVAWM